MIDGIMKKIKHNLVALTKDGELIIFDDQKDYRDHCNTLGSLNFICVMKTEDLIHHYIKGLEAGEKLDKILEIINIL